MSINKKMMNSRKRWRLIFCLCVLALPIAQFCIMYIGVNIRSVLMAFQKYDTATGVWSPNGVNNFVQVWHNLSEGSILRDTISNSLTVWIIGLFVGTVLALMFSYYLYKKCFLTPLFKVMLFLPSMISVTVLVTLYQYFVDAALPDIIGIEGLLTKKETIFPTIVFFNLWIGFGTNVIMYTNAMSGIDESIMEYSKLEGVKPFRELVSIVCPLIYPTITTFLVVGIAGIFTNQLNLYIFYSEQAPKNIMVLGYYMFTKVVGKAASLSEYPYAAAMGIMCTCIAAPITIAVRFILDKFDPVNGGAQ